MRRLAQAVVVLAAIAIAGVADAAAAVRVVDVPGVSGRAVSIAAAGRLADGGAIVAGTLTPSGRRARPRLVVMRLRHDGLIDGAFGDDGVVTVQLARGDGRGGSRATSVAVDPDRGRAWIGAAIGRTQAGAVLALDGRGRRVRGFGSRGVLRLRGDGSAPVALAHGGDRLAVAASRKPCLGCQLLMLDDSSGARRAQRPLAPVAAGDAARCTAAAVTSLALAGASRLVLGGTGGEACPTRVVVRDGALDAVADWQAPGRTVVAAAGSPLDLCVGSERDGAVSLARVAAASATALPAATWPPVAGSVAAVVALGDRACGALLRRPGRPALVLQASDGDARPAVTTLPAGLRAGALYRCKRHVLAIGTRRAGGRDRAAVAVTPIVRR